MMASGTKANFAFRRKAYLFLLNRLRVSRDTATNVVKNMARKLNAAQRDKRLTLAKHTPDMPSIVIPEDVGYHKFAVNELPGVAEVVADCRKVFQAYSSSGRLLQRMQEVAKPFLVQVTDSPDELMRQQGVRKFVLSDTVLNTAARYMGSVPLLTEVQLLWSPVNDSITKSQQYHFDAEDFRQLKIFVNIEDVTAESGPFTLISSRLSEKVRDMTGYVGGRRTRLTDDLVAANVGPEDEVSIIGPAGAGIVCDTSRCLHFGSRGNKRERLVLLIQFMDFFAPKIEPTDWLNATADAPIQDERQALVLNLA